MAEQLHRRRSGHPPPVLHEPRRPGVRARQPARGREGRAVRRATRAAHKSLRRLFLDEFVGDLDLTGDLTVDATVGLRARRGALRPRVPRVRRRLRRAARRRAPRVRAGVEPAHQDPRVGPAHGVPRAVDALHPVRQHASAAATATTATAEVLDVAARLRATSPTWTRCSTPTPSCCRSSLDWARERYPKEPGDSDFVYKQTIKAKACDAVRGILPAATLSNVGIYGTGQALRGAAAAHARPPAARGAPRTPTMMLDELRKVIPSFLTRVDRPDRGGRVERVPRRDPHATPRRSSSRHLRRRASPSRARASRSPTSIPTARTSSSRRSATRTRTCPRTRSWPGCARLGDRRAGRAARGVRRGAREPPPQARAGRSSASTTASTCSPTTARSATCSVTACSPSSGSRCRPRHGYDVPEAVEEAGLARPRSTRRWSARPRCTTRWLDRFPEQASYAVALAYRCAS